MKRRLICLFSAFALSAILILSVGYVQAQTPGQIPVFDQPGTGACNNAGGNDCIDSVITQFGGNIGIGITTPAALLDVVGGNVNLENSTHTSGNILKGGFPFLSNFGRENVFLGVLAGGNFTASGFENTAVGFWALRFNADGNHNTAIGASALEQNTTGGSNTATGLFALRSNTTGFNNIAIGVNALDSNTAGSRNTASGSGALIFNTSSDNTAIGYLTLASNTTGSRNTAIGSRADVSQGDLTNATAIGAGAIVDASNKIRLGDTAVTVVEGPPYSTVSDKNAKENFKPVDVDEVLRKIRHLNVTSWNYIGQDPKQFRHYGPVAQDFFAAFGDDGVGTIGSPTTITSTDMNGVLVLAVQALGRENDAFEAENAELKTRIEALEELVKRTPQ